MQLGATNVTDWSLASGATLTLNGTGKSGGGASDGALRFQTSGTHTASFTNPVVLASDARVTSAPAGSTAILSGIVSGDGGLTKSGPGTLILNNAGNSYMGDTNVLAGGPLSITTPFLNADADVYLDHGLDSQSGLQRYEHYRLAVLRRRFAIGWNLGRNRQLRRPISKPT